jgi:1-aminocyclopropane-1-carboxylate synthase
MESFYPNQGSTQEPSEAVTIRAMSARAATSYDSTSGRIWTILSDIWDPESNQEGYVTLGVADNALLQNDIIQRINKCSDVPKHILTYNNGPSGSLRCKTAIARFLNRHLSASLPIESADVVVTNGVASAMEHCSWAICDPGDGILLGRPYYRGFLGDLGLRPNVRVVPVSFDTRDPLDVSSVAAYERTLLTSLEQGVKIKAVMLCNPHNPLGRCYSREFLIQLMKLCQKHSIHLISDEIYALSVWRHGSDDTQCMQPFTSVLSINLTDILDPALLHALWGMSKDFGANGLRCGVVISRNHDLIECLSNVGIFSFTSGLTDHVVSEVLEDDQFTDTYISSNRKALLDAYEFVTATLEGMGVPYVTTSNAALFIWCDLLTPFLQGQSTVPYAVRDTDELWLASGVLAQKLDNARVHVGVPDQFGCELPGWFRLTISRPRAQLKEGLRRINRVIKNS